MDKHLLDYNLKVRLPIILFVVIAVFAVTYYSTYAERNGIGYSPEQPVKFSHKLHAGSMQIDCKYCHTGVDKSRNASIPSVDICMNCHTLARKDRPEIQKLTDYYEKNRPLEWKRIHKVPDFVYFNHSAHVNKGIDCANCHGDVKQMEVVGQVNSFTMGACLACHRKPETKISNYEEIKGSLKKGPEYCVACHR
ncbi:MAG: cytochrome c family protein [Bacteroidetes bacterium]|nr:cytochrome c family protein [Bacteroidota bacterium]